MNVILDKPIRRGEQRHGVLSREMNGTVCFDETDQQWLNRPARRTLRLKKFERFGTRVSRKGDRLKITLELSALSKGEVGDLFEISSELTDALLYCARYQERRARP